MMDTLRILSVVALLSFVLAACAQSPAPDAKTQTCQSWCQALNEHCQASCLRNDTSCRRECAAEYRQCLRSCD